MSAGGPIQMAGGLLQAYGQIQQGEGQAKAYEFNANVADQNSNRALFQSAQEERQQRIQARQQIGQMRADYGASGVTMEGSPMDVLAESVANAEMDALNIRYGGQVKAANFRNEATMNRYAASQSRSAGYYGAASSLLSTYGKVANSIPMGGS